MLRRGLLVAAFVSAVLSAPAHATRYAWAGAGDIAQARYGVASAVLPDGRVLLAGGWQPAAWDVATVDIYDQAAQTWTAGPALPEPRRDASAVTLRDGRVLVVGGEDPGDRHTAEIFDPAAGSWTRAASSIAEHASTTGFLLDDGRVLFLGGGDYSSDTPGGEIYDPARDAWTLTAPPHAVGGAGRPVVRLRDGRFLVVGTTPVPTGSSSYDAPRAEIYDAARDTWTEVAPPRYVGEGSGAALLPDGRVLVAGGRPGGGPENPLDATAHRHAEIFDPATGIWSPTGELNEPRAAGTAFVTLADGRVAAIGGSWATIVGPVGQRQFGQIFSQATSEVYDPASGSWELIPPMSQARAGHVAARLADDSVLVASGAGAGDGPWPTAAERLVLAPDPPAGAAPPGAAPPQAEPAPKQPGTLRFVKGPKRLTRAGILVVKLRCSRGGAACTDRLLLRGRTLERRSVSVRAGATVSVRVKLTVAARRVLRHRATRVTVSLRRQGTKLRVVVRA